MSEVISFRLSRDNPREAQALEVLRAWGAEGHGVRHIITEALLNLDASKIEAKMVMVDELTLALSQVGHLLKQFGNDGTFTTIIKSDIRSQSTLTDGFVASVRKSAKLGLKLDE